MRETSALWRELLELPGTDREYAFEIGGVRYGRENEISHRVEQSLFRAPSIGCARAAKLTLSLFAASIPAGAEIRRFVRLKNGAAASEWLSAGVFSISRRSRDGDRWEITAFDALRRADVPWTPDQTLSFPLSMGTAAADCARVLGTALDPRCVFLPDWQMSWPGDCTVREALSWIAAAYGGNWTVSPSGLLRLVPLTPLPVGGILPVGQEVTDFRDRGTYLPVSRVTLRIDGKTAATAGDDSGFALEADCPDGTESMAQTVLARLSGWSCRAFTARAAALDPAAELGDWAAVCGATGMLGEVTDRGDGYPDIAAPGEGAAEDETPGPMTRSFDWRLRETRSVIEKTAEEILLSVDSQVSGLSSSLSVQLDGITGRVSDAEAGLSQTLRLAPGGVTITNAAGDTLTIDGGQIDASAIHAADLQLTGRIAWTDLASDARGQVDAAGQTAAAAENRAIQAINAAGSAAGLAQSVSQSVSGWTYPGTTYIDGRMLMTGTVRAGTIEGGEVYLLDADAARAGSLTLTGASSYDGSKVVLRSGALELAADWGELYLHGWYGTAFGIGSYLRCEGNIAPTQSGVHSCGMAGNTWTDIWADNGVIQRSDLRAKTDVSYALDAYETFYDRLAPMSYRFTDGRAGRRHIGLGAQDVETALAAAGIPDTEFAGFVRSSRETEAGAVRTDYALRYGEFIPLNIWQIQRLKRRVAALEARLGADTGEAERGEKGSGQNA